MIHTSQRRAARLLPLVCACILAAGCSGGDGGTGAAPLKVRLQATPSSMTGAWEGGNGPSNRLVCRPQLQTTATGTGRAVWTGGTSVFTTPAGSNTNTFTAGDVTLMLGGDGVSAGQPLTAVLPKAGAISFSYKLTVSYTVEGTGETGSASASFSCDTPP